MVKKIENILDYVPASEAAALLSEKYKRPIRPNYISKMAKCKKHSIRVAAYGSILVYHRGDIEACNLTQKRTSA